MAVALNQLRPPFLYGPAQLSRLRYLLLQVRYHFCQRPGPVTDSILLFHTHFGKSTVIAVRQKKGIVSKATRSPGFGQYLPLNNAFKLVLQWNGIWASQQQGEIQ